MVCKIKNKFRISIIKFLVYIHDNNEVFIPKKYDKFDMLICFNNENVFTIQSLI